MNIKDNRNIKNNSYNPAGGKRAGGNSVNYRRGANIILASVFIIFILATLLKYFLPYSFTAGLIAFTAEAALIGGIADWFAVTALFRKPLGFSWHTAIIPNNRDIIIEKVSDIVSSELLSPESIKNRLNDLDLADFILEKISLYLDGISLENSIQGFFESRAGGIDKDKISREIDKMIKEGLKGENVSSGLRDMLNRAFSEGRHEEWLAGLLDKAVDIAKKPSTRERILKILREQEKLNEENTGTGSFFAKTLINMSRNSKHTNIFNIAGIIQQELVRVLMEISIPEHPVFGKMADNSSELLKRLDEDQVLLQIIQTWKNGILDRVDLLETLQKLISSIIETQNGRNEAAVWLAGHLDSYRELLGGDAGTREWINNLLKHILEKIIISEHYLISDIVGETLGSFTNDRLVQFIEEKAGNDLQWIRINGSIVGSAAGFLIYLFLNLLYIPYLAPFIHRFFGIG